MTLQANGQISASQINTELGLSSTSQLSLGDVTSRTLSGVASGTLSLSNFYGKSNRVTLTYTYNISTPNASINISTLGGYISGKSDVTITINSGIIISSASTANAALTLTGGATGDTITIINNGIITGKGGAGGDSDYYPAPGATAGGNGGPAISLGFNTSINNTSGYIYGGGGGGGGGGWGEIVDTQSAYENLGDANGGGGGGGAGYGAGGTARYSAYYGGAIGYNGSAGLLSTGGGGGAGGTITAQFYFASGGTGGNGGNSGAVGTRGGDGTSNWTYYSSGATYGAAGKAVNLNGKTVTWLGGNNGTQVKGAVA